MQAGASGFEPHGSKCREAHLQRVHRADVAKLAVRWCASSAHAQTCIAELQAPLCKSIWSFGKWSCRVYLYPWWWSAAGLPPSHTVLALAAHAPTLNRIWSVFPCDSAATEAGRDGGLHQQADRTRLADDAIECLCGSTVARHDVPGTCCQRMHAHYSMGYAFTMSWGLGCDLCFDKHCWF